MTQKRTERTNSRTSLMVKVSRGFKMGIRTMVMVTLGFNILIFFILWISWAWIAYDPHLLHPHSPEVLASL